MTEPSLWPLTAWNDDADLAAAGYVLAPEGRYVDEAHGIDWAVIVWACPADSCPVRPPRRAAPGPGEPPHCVLHGPMTPVMSRVSDHVCSGRYCEVCYERAQPNGAS